MDRTAGREGFRLFTELWADQIFICSLMVMLMFERSINEVASSTLTWSQQSERVCRDETAFEDECLFILLCAPQLIDQANHLLWLKPRCAQLSSLSLITSSHSGCTYSGVVKTRAGAHGFRIKTSHGSCIAVHRRIRSSFPFTVFPTSLTRRVVSGHGDCGPADLG